MRSAIFICATLLLNNLCRGDELTPYKFRTLAVNPDPIEGLYVNSSNEFKELKFARNFLSSSFDVQVQNALNLYHQIPGEGGETTFALHSQIPIPSGSTQGVLIGLTGANGPMFNIIDDNLDAARNTDWMLVNATKENLVFNVGDSLAPIPIASGKSVMHTVKAKPGGGALVKVAFRQEEEWKKFYSSVWPIYEDQRYFILFVPNGDSVRLVKYFDVVQ
ncbi:MAG: hypothetical protein AAGJ81_00405 [Verrucomicrobiota bacterium]